MRSHGGDAAGGTVRLIVARPRRRIGNVPAEATSFVGRRRELAETRKALAGARLASLVGPGGVGKTRLAVRAATDLQRGYWNSPPMAAALVYAFGSMVEGSSTRKPSRRRGVGASRIFPVRSTSARRERWGASGLTLTTRAR